MWTTDDDDDDGREPRGPRLRLVLSLGRLPWRGKKSLRLGGALGLACALLLTLAAIGLAGTGHVYEPIATATLARSAAVAEASPRALKEARTAHRKLTTALQRLTPKETYIAIDRASNRLYLRRADEVLLDTACSAGSGWLLRDVRGDRQWVFDTPLGRFEVRSRVENPVWRKPDWAFIESGEPVPKDPGERIEYGSLGEYALYLRDGYMIHGTLYERMLGRSVTHGCVRLGRDDLRTVWRSTRVGTSVYIF